MTNEIQQNRWDQTLRRVAGLIGPGSKVSEVLSEIFPTFDVEQVPAELRVLGGTNLCFRGTAITAPAGEENASQLSNPADSGVLITVTSLSFSVNATTDVNISMNETLLANSNGFGQFRDRRSGPISSAAVGNTRIETGRVINPGITILFENAITFVLNDPDGICVLPPDSRLTIGTDIVAKVLTVNYFWRERPAERSELLL